MDRHRLVASLVEVDGDIEDLLSRPDIVDVEELPKVTQLGLERVNDILKIIDDAYQELDEKIQKEQGVSMKELRRMLGTAKAEAVDMTAEALGQGKEHLIHVRDAILKVTKTAPRPRPDWEAVGRSLWRYTDFGVMTIEDWAMDQGLTKTARKARKLTRKAIRREEDRQEEVMKTIRGGFGLAMDFFRRLGRGARRLWKRLTTWKSLGDDVIDKLGGEKQKESFEEAVDRLLEKGKKA